MTPDQQDTCLKYLIQKLSPQEQDELHQLLGEQVSDLAEDAIKGRIAMDHLPPRIMRQVSARVAEKRTAADDAAYRERFPNWDRLK